MESANGTNTIRDYEWTSVSSFIVYVSQVAGLKEISANAIYSFGYARHGPKKLMLRKIKAEALLNGNLSKLTEYVKLKDDRVDEQRLSVIRGMFINIKEARDIVTGHIERIEQLLAVEQAPFGIYEATEEKNTDDIPF